MNAKILNRSGTLPEDGWYQIEVSGEHLNPSAKVVQVIDGPARAGLLNRFQRDAAQPNFAGLRIDRDHLSLNPDNTTEALGWLMNVREREGQLEGQIDWTSIGRPLVEGKVFKFFSTVYPADQVERIGTRKINNREYPAIRPLCLECLALTNDPNNRGGKPISNRNGNPAGAAEETQPDNNMNRLLKALGLAEGASEDSAVAALQLITNRASTAEGQVVTITKERDTLLAAQVESDLTKYVNRYKVENKEKIRAALIANRAGTIELLEATEAPATEGDDKRITNRSAAKTPAKDAAGKQNGDDQVRSAKIANRASELKNAAPQRSFDSCWQQAQREQPAS